MNQRSLLIVLLAASCAAAEYNPIDTTPAPVKGGILDLSYLNNSPAGAHGRVISDAAGDLYYENQPGKTVRFHGGNLGFDLPFPAKEDASTIADRLSMMGYNAVRLHSYDSMPGFSPRSFFVIANGAIGLDAEYADRFDYFVSELKSRGIHVVMDLFVGLPLEKIPAVEPYITHGGRSSRKFAICFTEEGFAVWKEMATLFLTHTNPYTGLAPKDDPVYLSISPVNEDTLASMKYGGGSEFAINDRLARVVLTEINRHITTKHGEPPLKAMYNSIHDLKPPYAGYVIEFLTEKTRAHYGKCRDVMRSLGYQGLIGGINFINNPLVSLWRQENCDVYETHQYYASKLQGLDNKGWVLATKTNPGSGFKFPKEDCVRLTEYFAKGKSDMGKYFPALSLNMVYGMPFFLTEYNTRIPFPGREETGVITAAVGRFSDWDDLNRFSFSPYPEQLLEDRPLGEEQLIISGDPPSILSEHLASLLFRGDYLKVGRTKFAIVRDRKFSGSDLSAAYAATPPGTANGDFRGEMGYVPHLFNVRTIFADYPDRFGILSVADDSALAALSGGNWAAGKKVAIPKTVNTRTLAELLIDGQQDETAKAMQRKALAANTLVSDTGELTLDLNTFTYRINAPAVVSVCGTMKGREFVFPACSVKSDLNAGSFVLIALDQLPLARSGRMLIVFISDVRATEEQFEDKGDGSIEYRKGTLPTLALRADLSFSLLSERAASLECFRVAMNGQRMGEVALSREAGKVSATLDTSHGFVFELSAFPDSGSKGRTDASH